MQEGWPGTPEPSAPWSGKPQKDWSGEISARSGAIKANEKAKKEAINGILAQYTEEEMHNMIYDELEDLFMNRFADVHPQGRDPDAEEISSMMQACGIFEPEEKYDMEKSDIEDPPGYMPGEGGKY